MCFDDVGPIWHMCTPGNWPGVLFKCRDDYVFGMNMVALAAWNYKRIKIFTFQLMSNHLHFVMVGNKNDVIDFSLRLRDFC